MKKQYVLWLDESGDFNDNQSKKQKHLKPSLVGGMLLEKSMVFKIDLDTIIDSDRTHAMELKTKDKTDYILPILERFKTEFKGREVFFENANYDEGAGSRDLYLNVITEGILQLLQYLNAYNESLDLEVIIAHRMDGENSGIDDVEYIGYIEHRIYEKIQKNCILLDKNTTFSFSTRYAYKDQRLQIADFACNTRLTRDSKAFRDTSIKARVNALYENALIFSMSEISEENRIQRFLTNGQIADSIMELFTANKVLDDDHKSRIMQMIIKRINNSSYRLLKAEMKNLSSDIIARVAQEDDYEVMEELLETILKNLIPELENTAAPTDILEFNLLLQLADVYLREGDTDNARTALEKCTEVQKQAGNALEQVFSYYQLLEKKAVLEIDEFNYKAAVLNMNKASEMFESIMEALPQSELINERFPSLKSEYYGDVLCMKIYALMFLQREDESIYTEMVRLSDIALEQYPDRPGERERHMQYRSHIELEAGNYEDALRWLTKAKCYEIDYIDVDAITEFLKLLANTETTISCWYYLMYYTEIMAEAKKKGDTISDVMYTALLKAEELRKVCGIVLGKTLYRLDNEVDISGATVDSKAKYHPEEIVCWKIAEFCMIVNKKDLSKYYFERALEVCYQKDHNYKTMRIIGLGIRAAYIGLLVKTNCAPKDVKNEYSIFVKTVNELLEEILNEPARERIEEIRDLVDQGMKLNQLVESRLDSFDRASRMITY